jgi:hypothetical protein
VTADRGSEYDSHRAHDLRYSGPIGDRMKIGRNDPCHCGSGQKYKKCHLASDDAARSAELSAAAAAAAEAQAKADAEAAEAEEKSSTSGGEPGDRPAPARAKGGAGGPKTSAPRPPPAFRRKSV